MVKWEQLFKTFGFSESASKIYLAALQLGPSPVQDIARKVSVSRMTAYTVIEALMKEGLMSTLKKGKKTLYAAESPERLVSFMHGRVKQMEGVMKELEYAAGELKLLQRGEKPVVKMFEGQEGHRAILDDIIANKPDVVYEIGNLDAIHSLFPPEVLKPFKEELIKRNIGARGIYSMGEGSYTPRRAAKVKLLRHGKGAVFAGDISIYGNKIALMTFRGKLIGVLIESEELAKTMREVFELAWENSALEGEDTL